MTALPARGNFNRLFLTHNNFDIMERGGAARAGQGRGQDEPGMLLVRGSGPGIGPHGWVFTTC